MEPTIVVHGGAWAVPDDLVEQNIFGVKTAARNGFRVLASATAIDAVEVAVTSLENNPVFGAGTGSALNAIGEVEMDAIIMEGTFLRTGAVACVKNIQNPVHLARLLMEKTNHALVVGEGANMFAKQMNINTVHPRSLVTEHALKELESHENYKSVVHHLFTDSRNGIENHDTVGAVAIDSFGHVACATSTGGITAKMVGRVGDSPLIGCGAYCDDNIGAVSTTGHGESIMKICLAKYITELLEKGLSPENAVKTSLQFMLSRVKGCGGAIAVDKKGDVGIHFTTNRMPWCSIKNGTLSFGINSGDYRMETYVD